MSLTRPNAGDIARAFNYVIPVYDKSGESIITRLWFIDSGAQAFCYGKYGYDCVKEDQIKWFREENNKILETDPSKGKGFLFLHIPLTEYMYMANSEGYYGTKGEVVCCGIVNTGLFAAIKE